MHRDTRGLSALALGWLAMFGASLEADDIAPLVLAPMPGQTPAVAEAPAAVPAPAPSAPAANGFPFLPGEDTTRALSIGDTSDGALVGGRAIEASAALGILPRQRARGLYYGSDALVGVLEDAAQRFHGVTGRRLWVGHLSRHGGGDIPYSVSHNAGRDADLLFCYRDGDPSDLIPLSGDGVSKDGRYTLDAACSWQLVRALLEAGGDQLQYLFVSGSLEGALIQHAVVAGEPPAMIDRAAALMMQPGRAAPHHDHFHLRVYCAEADVRAGCIDAGKVHPWAPDHTAARADAIAGATVLLSHDDAEVRARALARLGLLAAGERADDIAARLEDAPLVQRAAAASLALLGEPHTAQVLSAAQPAPVRLAAIAAIADAERLAPVPRLIELLADGDPTIRDASRDALRRLTGRDEASRARWRAMWDSMRRAPRRAWLSWAFRDAGYDVQLEQHDGWTLLRALVEEQRLSRHAADALAMLFAHDPPVVPRRWDDLDARRDLCRHWTRWLADHDDLFALGTPPAHACDPER